MSPAQVRIPVRSVCARVIIIPARRRSSWFYVRTVTLCVLHSVRPIQWKQEDVCLESVHIYALPESDMDVDAHACSLRSCSNAKDLLRGRLAHDHICRHGLEWEPYLQSLLIQMYVSTGSLDDALVLFASMHPRKAFVSNCIIWVLTQHGRVDDAVQLFEQMHIEGVMPDKFTFLGILSACGRVELLNKVKQIHTIIENCGIKEEVVLATSLISTYGKCGSLESAQTTFQKIHRQDAISWTAMLSVYVHQGLTKQALQLFAQMMCKSIWPTNVTFVCIFVACSRSMLLAEAMLLHACVEEFALKEDLVLGNSLVKMYDKCGSVDDACCVFCRLQQKDIVSWNSMMGAYANHGHGKEALQLFACMVKDGMVPNQASFVCILDACTSSTAQIEGKQMHNYIVHEQFDSDSIVLTALLNMYGKCGSTEDARILFDKMEEHSVISWTTIIGIYTQHGMSAEALRLFDTMQLEGVQPNAITFVWLLETCAHQAVLVKGKYVHALILSNTFMSDAFIGNALIDMYGKCGSIEDARNVFYAMPQHDLISWTTLIGVCAQHGQGKQALLLFDKMRQEKVSPNEVTFICVLDACSGARLLGEGRQVHDLIIKSEVELDIDVVTALMLMYGKCGSLKDAVVMFENLSEHCVISWTAVIGAYTQSGLANEALQLFEEMQQQGVMPNKATFVSLLDAYDGEPSLLDAKQMHARIMECGFESDAIMSNALLNMYGRCHSISDAWQTFDKMREKDVVSWTSMIAVCAQHGQGKKALQLFDEMQHVGLHPNKVTFLCALGACASFAALARGEYIHHLIARNKLETDVVIGTALLNMYGKCGNIDRARAVFDMIPDKNSVCWTAMVAVYAEYGRQKEALYFCEQMQREGFKPGDVTFLNLLAACSHSGLVEEASHFFASIIKDRVVSVPVDYYACMIDVLGRAGRLKEAEILMNAMPFRPTIATSMGMLGACRYQADIERGKCVATQLFELDYQHPAPYVMLSNIHATSGWEDAVIHG